VRSVLNSGSSNDRALLADVGDVIEASHLRSLPRETILQIVAEGSRLCVPAGSTIHWEGDSSAHLELVVSGLVRVYVRAPDGRTMTVRYCRTGALIGAVSLFATPFSLPATIQAVTDTDVLVLRSAMIRGAADRDVRVARALLDELTERVLSFIAEIPGSAFTTVRQRVARHLLDLATEGQTGAELVAAIGQQDLADAVGTVREVVVRTLRELRAESLVRTGRAGIVILDADRLSVEASPGGAGTKGPIGRNEGS
jgi:CRP/FNR family cyclic AMP-dependent transcriptional regulator